MRQIYTDGNKLYRMSIISTMICSVMYIKASADPPQKMMRTIVRIRIAYVCLCVYVCVLRM